MIGTVWMRCRGAGPASRPTSSTAWSPSPASFLQHPDSRLPLVLGKIESRTHLQRFR